MSDAKKDKYTAGDKIKNYLDATPLSSYVNRIGKLRNSGTAKIELSDKYIESINNKNFYNDLNDNKYSDVTKVRAIHNRTSGVYIFHHFISNMDMDSINKLSDMGALTYKKIETGRELVNAVADGLKSNSGLVNELFAKIVEANKSDFDLSSYRYKSQVSDIEAMKKVVKRSHINSEDSRKNIALIKMKIKNDNDYSDGFIEVVREQLNTFEKNMHLIKLYADFYRGCELALINNKDDAINKGDIEKTIKIVSSEINKILEKDDAYNDLEVIQEVDRRFFERTMEIKAEKVLKSGRRPHIFGSFTEGGFGSLILNLIKNENNTKKNAEVLDFISKDNEALSLAIIDYSIGESLDGGTDNSNKKSRDGLDDGRAFLRYLEMISSLSDDKILELSDKINKTSLKSRMNIVKEIKSNDFWKYPLIFPAAGKYGQLIIADLLELNPEILIMIDDGTGRIINNAVNAATTYKLVDIVNSGYMSEWRSDTGESIYHAITSVMYYKNQVSGLKKIYETDKDWVAIKDNSDKTPLDVVRNEQLRNELSKCLLKKAAAENKNESMVKNQAKKNRLI